MRNCTVRMCSALSGRGLGDGSSETGISTSTVPTLYGPVYWGKVGTGFSEDSIVADDRWIDGFLAKGDGSEGCVAQ